MNKHIKQYLASSVALLMALAMLTEDAHAASITKTNNIDDLNLASSWVTNGPPTSADIATWNSESAGGSVSLGTSQSWSGIFISSGTPSSVAITDPGATTLSLGAGGISLNNVTNASNRGITVVPPIALTASQTWGLGSGAAANITASGVISGSYALSAQSAPGNLGVLYLNAANTFNGGFTNGANAIVCYTNVAPVASGGVLSSSAFGTGPLTIKGGILQAGAKSFYNPSVTINGDFTWATTARDDTSGNFDFGGATNTITLTRAVTPTNAPVSGGNNSIRFTAVGGSTTNVFRNGAVRFAADSSVAATNFVQVHFATVGTGNNVFENNMQMILGPRVYACFASSSSYGNALTEKPAVTIENGGYYSLADNTAARGHTIFSLDGAGTVTAAGSSASVDGQIATLTINGGTKNSSSDFSGVIRNVDMTTFPWSDPTYVVAITKSGSTTQILSGPNTYSGLTTVSAGKLVTSTLSSNGAYTVSAGATLGVKVAAASTSLKMINFTNPSSSVLEVDLGTVGNSSTPVIVNAGNNHTTNGTVAVNLLGSKSAMSLGTFTVLTNLTRTGTGKYVLGTVPAGVSATLADNTNSVEITISAINPLWVWSGAANGNWDIGTSLNWLNDSLTSIAYTEPALGVVFDDTATGATNVNLTTTVSPPSVTLANTTAKNFAFSGSGKISGSTGITKSGNGIVTMGTANDYSGTTLVSSGTLKLGASGVIPDGAGKGNVTVDGTLDLAGYSETLNGLGGAGKIDASTGGSVLTVGAGDTTSSFAGSITNSSGVLALTKSGNGTLTLSGAGTYSGGTLVSAGILETTTGKLGSGNVTNNSVLSLSGSFTFTNNVSGTGQLIKNGGVDTLVFIAGNNTHSGGTIVNSNSGTFLIDSASALGAGSTVTVLTNSALRMSNNITVFGKSLSLAGSSGRGSLASATGSDNTWSGNITLTQDGARFNSRATAEEGTLRLPGVIDSGTNIFGINVRYGTVRFSGANTYLGGTTFAAGTGVLDGGHNRLPVTTTVNMGFGLSVAGLLDLNGWNQEIAGLQLNASNTNGSPSSSVFNNTGTQSILTVNAGTNATAYGGQIDGNIALVKTGTNSFRLNGNNSYSGTTTVDAGTLLIDGNNGSSAVTVNANGTLGGLGTIGGNVTFNSGSHAVFTNGALLTISGSLNIATSGTIPDVHLNLPDSGLTAGNYTLATYNATGSSGAFAATPIVDSGSLNGNNATIVTGGGNVVLQVTAGGSPVLTNSFTGGVLTLSWPAGWTLQAQTNSLSTGLNTNSASWYDTGATSPLNVTPNPANGAVFYRLKQ